MASWLSSAFQNLAVQDLAVWVSSAVGSVVVEKLVEMGINSFSSKRMLPVDSEEALKRVQAALPQIRAVMGVAEALKIEDPSSREWVQRFREAVDAAEDVIDELEYKKLEDMVQNRSADQVAGSYSGSKKRKRTGDISGDILERWKKAVTMLDEATAGVEDLLQRAAKLGIHYLSKSQYKVCPNLRQETTSFLAERKVFGRDDEKAQIIGWLKRETETPLSSVGIVGVGGLGKTTLAQSVNQELSGSGYFEKIIWVCVSSEFSVERITKNILAGMKVEYRSDDPLDVLQQNLKEKIHTSKKVLLILDDVWEDGKRGHWEQLVAPLRFAQGGSKILFTTRQTSVADLLASVINTEQHQSLALPNMEEEDLRLLFNCYAFDGFNPNQYGDLQAIGDQIVKKLHGNPLAAKVIGSLLNSRMDSLYWRRISSHDSLINLEQANGVMDVLKLSYYNLPADLQVCFRFCSIFPQDQEFDKKELIQMWMASGFIQKQSREGRRPEDIGEDYFNLLLKKSFFEKYAWWGERYVMHDLIHELAQNVSNGECCRVAPGDKLVAIPSTVRHVSIHEGAIQKVFHLENIRSLVITICEEEDQTNNPNPFVLPNNLVKKSLRLLKINAYRSCKLPEEMSCLVHLRYLSIELKFINQSLKYLLPASIYKLYHLLVLEFKEGYLDSSDSGIETTGLTNLVSLRYMRLPDEIMKTICGVHRMISLQKLTFFVGKKSGYRINELRTLNNLRRLTILNIENIGDPAEATSANLLANKNLESLSLECTEESKLDNPEQIFDNLRPYQNLMELVIMNYKGQRSPVWIGDLPYLKVLNISRCPNLVQLPDMPLSLTELQVDGVGLAFLPNFGFNTPTLSSQKSSLRTAIIGACPNLISLNGFLEQGNLELQGLEKLTIRGCENLAQVAMHAFRTTVSLKELIIEHCPNLVQLPDMHLSLTKFRVLNVGLTSLPNFGVKSPTRSCQKSSLIEVEIWNCPNIISLNRFLEQGNLELQDLEELTIRDCEHLAQLAMHAFRTTVSLKELSIENCPNLVQLPDMPLSLTEFRVVQVGLTYLPNFGVNSPTRLSQKSSLRKVEIWNCPNLISLNGFLEQGNLELQGLEKLTIRGCENLAQVAMHAFRTTVSLKDLIIEYCPNLVQLPDMHLSLTKFRVLNVGLTSLPNFGVKSPTRSCQKSSLIKVEIWNCPNLISLNGFFEQSNLELQGLEELTIRDCEHLAQLAMHAFRTTVSLKELSIENCQNLVQLPDMPLSLTEFRVVQVGMTSLPNFGFNSPTRSSQKSSHRKVEIWNCPNLISLNGFLEQGNLELQGLEKLTIRGCENLAQVARHAFRTTMSLKELSIEKCPNLVQLPDMPLSLTEFRVVQVGLTSLPNFGVNSPTRSSQKSSLRKVEIWNCPNLISLNGFLEQANLELQGLEKLTIRDCEHLAQLAMHAFRTTVSLKKLSIENCPNLVQLPDMHLSLTEFLVVQVGLTFLPNFGVESPTRSSQKSSLREVEIWNCPNLISLNGFLEQGNLELQGLEKLTIGDCENLAQLAMHAFRTTVSLKELSIKYCPNLVQLPDMPLSLTEFRVLNVGLTSLPNFGVNSPTRSSQKSSLRKVEIWNCPNLISLNGFLEQGNLEIQGLEELTIRGCENLAQLAMHAFGTTVSLKELSIEYCSNLVQLPDMPLSLTEFLVLNVGLTSLPNFGVNNSTRSSQKSSLREVVIWNCPNLISLNGFLEQGNLKLQGLEKLTISDCENLAQLAMHAFRTTVSLKVLSIENCPNLVQLPGMPLSLTEFRVLNVGLTSLPNFGVNSPTRSSQKSSLREVEIWKCPNLISLNGFLEQGNLELQGLEKLTIRGCENLAQVARHALRTTVSLKELSIEKCPNLVQLPDMPLSLTEFRVVQVGPTSLPNFGVSSPTRSSQKSPLRKVEIWNCPNLISLNGFVEQGNLELQGLEELTIRDCEHLAQLAMHAFRTTVSLKKLSIENCPNLVQLADMHLSLTEFRVFQVGLTSLPNFVVNSPTQSSQKSSLRKVEIWNCPNLISLNGFLEQGNLELQDLEELTICDCEHLAQLAMDAFRTTVSLKELSIENCPNLVQLPDMPLSLTEFRVFQVGLTSLPNFVVNSPTRSSQKSSLREVEIWNCPNLISLNGFLEQGNLELQGLEELTISGCENLAQLAMHAFRTTVSLKELSIEYCPNLVQLPDMPLSLTEFRVVKVGLTCLPNFGVNSPTRLSQKSSLKTAFIGGCPNLISLNGFLEQGNLELQDLEKLTISDCENLAQLAMHGFRTTVSLKELSIENCPYLVQLSDMPLSLTMCRTTNYN